MASPGADPASEVTRCTIELLRRGGHLVAGLAQASGLAPGDLRGLQALDVLGQGPVSVGALGEQLGLSSAATTGVVDRLTRAGLAERRTDPADRRRVLVALTDTARRFGAQHLRPLADSVDEAVRQVPAEDLPAVRTFLSNVIAAHDDRRGSR